MPAFKRFGPGDQLDNVLILEPQYDLASGSGGWRGGPHVSSSISLYGGARRSPASIFGTIEYQSLFPNVNQTGNPKRSSPLTASINLVRLTSGTLNLAQRDARRWGEEHWDTVMRLYEDYQAVDPDYVTSSYDHYSVFLARDSKNLIAAEPFSPGTASPVFISGAFTVEMWAKPFSTSSATNDFTLMSYYPKFYLGITGSTGRLVFSSSLGVFTSSLGPTNQRWNHIAVSLDSAVGSGTFYVNLTSGGSFPFSGTVQTARDYTGSICIGSVFAGPLFGGGKEEFASFSGPSSGVIGKSFHGLLGETRIWNGVGRTWTQLSSSMSTRLSAPFPTGAFMVFNFNDGPRSTLAGGPLHAGSGVLESVWGVNSSIYANAFLLSFNDNARPVWHVNDNVNVVIPKNVASGTSDELLVVDIPSAFYGRRIVPESLRLTCRAYSSGSYGLIRTIIDDGRGNLFISGSVCSGTTEDYRGVEWNKVGNVFYGEGLVVIKDPTLMDFGTGGNGQYGANSSHPSDVFQLSFRGDSRIPVKTLMCRIDHGEFNCSTNPTFWVTGSAGERLRVHPSGTIRASTIGLYNSDRELVGVARLAEPLRIRTRDRLNVRIRIDF